jgi:hypothetical protein
MRCGSLATPLLSPALHFHRTCDKAGGRTQDLRSGLETYGVGLSEFSTKNISVDTQLSISASTLVSGWQSSGKFRTRAMNPACRSDSAICRPCIGGTRRSCFPNKKRIGGTARPLSPPCMGRAIGEHSHIRRICSAVGTARGSHAKPHASTTHQSGMSEMPHMALQSTLCTHRHNTADTHGRWRARVHNQAYSFTMVRAWETIGFR